MDGHRLKAGAETLVEVLRRRAREHGERRAMTFLADGERELTQLSYADLDRRARAIAAELAAAGLHGERVLLLFPPGLDFATAFLGCLYAGTVAVPAYPPASRRQLPRLRSIAHDARPAGALTSSAAATKIRAAARSLSELEKVRWLLADGVPDVRAEVWVEPSLSAANTAFLQYTSGSTAEPKGVVVSHGNLLHNEEVIRRAFGLSEDAVVVGWLPLYHDMGLIGNLLQPLYLGASCVLMSPVAFLQKPVRWLRAISRYGASVSGGPDFAYALCVHRVTPAERQELDLSGWSVAFSGAEPVRAETLERFTAAFAPCGFRARAFYPCYGMAETTLMTTGGDPRQPPIETAVSAAALERDRVAAADPGAPARRLVACGHPGRGLEVRIIDPHSREPAAEDRVGEIWVAGASVARGYWQRPELSTEVFGARLASGEGPYLRSGDLGFFRDGELYVTGRLKDLVILRGRNHYPQDLELTAERSHPSLRPGCGAAVAVDVDGEERLVLIYEIERHRRDEPRVIAEAVRGAVAEEHEVQVHDVVLIRAGTVPKTSSGKIQRHACRAAYLADELTVIESSPLDSGAADKMLEDELPRIEMPAAGVELDRGALLELPIDERAVYLKAVLVDRCARLLRVARSTVDPERPLTALGLDSLAAIELQGEVEERFAVDLELELLLAGASLAEVAAEVAAGLEQPKARALDFAVSESDGGDHPASYGQRALWFLHRVDPAGSAYHLAGAARVAGVVDVEALEHAFEDLVKRHPALRTTFEERDGEPWARVATEPRLDFGVARLPSDSASLDRRLSEEAWKPFDLERGPLLRVRVLTDGEDADGAVLMLAIHHVVADFRSLAVMLEELGALYAARIGGPAASLEPPRARPADHARAQRRRLAGAEGERLLAYWRRRLEEPLPLLDLPTDRPRPSVQSFRGTALRRRFAGGLADGLTALARRLGTTRFALLAASYQTLLHRLSGQPRVLVGTPITVRDAPELSDVVGYFVNPVALRADFDDDLGFVDHLARARDDVLGALAHRELSFGLLTERLELVHDASRSPVFQTMFVWHQDPQPRDSPGAGFAALALGEPGARLRLGPLELEGLRLERQAAQFDLSLYVAELSDAAGGNELAASLEFNRDLFDPTTASRLLAAFEVLLWGIAIDPARPVSELPLFAPATRHQLLVEWGSQPSFGGQEESDGLHRLFAAQAARTPDAVAVVAGERELTYRELERAASRLAGRLRRLGVGPETPVGVASARTPEMVVGLLGVLAAGGAYVPLDPGYPARRLRFTVEDSGLGVILVHPELPAGLAGIEAEVVELAEILSGAEEEGSGPETPGSARPDNLAYLIYTSGSTGRPKGVAISHRSAATLVRWSAEVFEPSELSGVLASTSIAFDLSVFELFVPLCRGGRVVLTENALELPDLAAAGVSLVNTVPSAMAELAGRLPESVRIVNLAGEPLAGSLVERIYAQSSVEAVYNLYGPSEDTTYSTVARIPRDSALPPSIGRPVAGTRAVLLDRRQRPVAPGAVGEIFLAGAGLARGYLARPRLTAERFGPDPLAAAAGDPGARAYRTGDLGRFRADGEIEFLGRTDHQVKVRGFRIELGEIEAALAAHPEVREAVALAREDAPGDVQLVAYLVAAGAAPPVAEMRAWLGERIPAFMVPQAFVVLDELPLTPNGKIDRRALPPPERGVFESAQGFVAPETEVEEILAEVWREVLGVDEIGIYDSFFELGGHSLKATQVLSRVQEAFQVELPVRALLEAPTIAGLAEAIAQQLMAETDEEELAQILAEIE